jgi:hypothetical protein
MPSPHGFETPEDRATDAAHLRALGDQINPLVQAIGTDYLAALGLTPEYALGRHTQAPGLWFVDNQALADGDPPFSVNLGYPLRGAKQPTLFVAVAGKAAAVPRNLERLAVVLAEQTGCTVRLQRNGSEFLPDPAP